VNEPQALAANLGWAAVYLALFAAVVVMILAAMLMFLYLLGLMDLLRGGFLYARHARLACAGPPRCFGKPVPDVRSGAFRVAPPELHALVGQARREKPRKRDRE